MIYKLKLNMYLFGPLVIATIGIEYLQQMVLPMLSIPGVALASLITQSLALILQINLCIKKQLVKRSLSLILSILIFSFLTMLFIYLIKSYLPFKPSNLPFILLSGLLSTGIAMISTGMIKKNEWTHLFSETIR